MILLINKSREKAEKDYDPKKVKKKATKLNIHFQNFYLIPLNVFPVLYQRPEPTWSR